MRFKVLVLQENNLEDSVCSVDTVTLGFLALVTRADVANMEARKARTPAAISVDVVAMIKMQEEHRQNLTVISVDLVRTKNVMTLCF